MPQFDIHPVVKSEILVIDIQSDLLSHLITRAVIPLIPFAIAKDEHSPRLKPVLSVLNKDYVLLTTELGYLKTSHLKTPITNLSHERLTIIQAIDFLIQGF